MIGRAVHARYTWDVTAEERFERIERELTVTVQTPNGIAESQGIQAKTPR